MILKWYVFILYPCTQLLTSRNSLIWAEISLKPNPRFYSKPMNNRSTSSMRQADRDVCTDESMACKHPLLLAKCIQSFCCKLRTLIADQFNWRQAEHRRGAKKDEEENSLYNLLFLSKTNSLSINILHNIR